MPKPAELLNLSQVFTNPNRLFEIPDYQRGYAWEDRQINDLIEDLELLADLHQHFMGTLVLHLKPDTILRDAAGNKYSVYDVIDGQQRLTTLILFLNAILLQMQEANSLYGEIPEGLRKNYIFILDKNNQPTIRLKPNRDTRDYFMNNVLCFKPGVTGATIRSHQLLSQASRRFSAYLKEQQAARKPTYPEWLEKLYFKIVEQLTLIVYEVADEVDAGVIFETMNDRGKDLSQLERVKNYLLYITSKLELEATHDLKDRINSTWTHIFEQLMAAGLSDTENKNEDQLLRSHWLMKYNYDTASWKAHRSIKEYFSLRKYYGQHQRLLDDLYSYLDTLKNAASAYCDIYAPTRPNSFNDFHGNPLQTQVIEIGQKLARLGIRARMLPLLMAVRLKLVGDAQAYLELVQLLEKFEFRVYAWAGYYSTKYRSTLYRIGNQYFNSQEKGLQPVLDEIVRLLLEACPDKILENRFEMEDIDWYDWSAIKYFLYEYEQHLSGGRTVRMPWEDLSAKRKEDTIEHILPQTPKDSYWKQRFSKKQRDRWTNDIGNLTLTFDNSSLGNRPFPKKAGKPGQKGTYADSSLFIEHELAQIKDWDEAEIVKRRAKIRNWTLDRWNVAAPSPLPQQPAQKTNISAEEMLLSMADSKGTRAEFQAILDATKTLPIYARMQRQWWVVKFTPLSNKNEGLFWLGTELWFAADYANFETFLQIPSQKAEQLLGPERILKKSELDQFIANLYSLFEGI